MSPRRSAATLLLAQGNSLCKKSCQPVSFTLKPPSPSLIVAMNAGNEDPVPLQAVTISLHTRLPP